MDGYDHHLTRNKESEKDNFVEKNICFPKHKSWRQMLISGDVDGSGVRRGHSTREKESKRSRVRPTEDEDESRPQEETQAPPAGWWKTFNWKEGRACEVLSQDDWWQANVRRNENSKVSKYLPNLLRKQELISVAGPCAICWRNS